MDGRKMKKKSKKTQNFWVMVEGEESFFKVIEKSPTFFQDGRVEHQPLKGFLNMRTGEVRFFRTMAVEEYGVERIIKHLNLLRGII